LRKPIFILSLQVIPLLWSGLVQAEWFAEEQEKMGTRVEIQLWSDDATVAAGLIAQGMAELDRIEELMSTYIPTSEMSRVNEKAYADPQPVSAELFGLLETAIELSEATGGAFDISYDSVGQLYDFRAGKHPDAKQIEAQLENIDYHHIILDKAMQTVAFKTPGVRINLGGIAKGYAVEKVINVLREAGIEHALAAAGGDTRILGDRLGKPWIVGIRDPGKRDGIFTRMALNDEAISTSGDYERFFIEDGKRYHHILRPADGRPVEGVHSVSVIGPDGTLTDGLSTSLFVMGPEDGLKLLKQFPGYEALFVTNDNYYYSEGLAPD
jgi:thiamine biosynthesis lipoprotein